MTTDELIETLERLEKESAFRSDDFGLFVSNHLPALISALKENKMMREALEEQVARAEEASDLGFPPHEIASGVIRIAKSVLRAALQPQGEK